MGGNRCRIEIDQWVINRGLCAVYPEVALLCDRAPEVYCGWKPVTEKCMFKVETRSIEFCEFFVLRNDLKN